jgi:hypothetical protein
VSEPQSIFLFHASAHALRAEKVLRRAGVACKLIPVPRHLSSDCGVCLRVARRARDAARNALESAGVEVAAAHEV